jgi:SpoIID/LytB domain protein
MRFLLAAVFCCIFLFPIYIYSDSPGASEFSYSRQGLTVDNYLDIALLFKESGELELARQILQSCYAFSVDPRLLVYLGKLYYLSGEFQEAINILNEIKQKDWLVFLYLGLSYEGLDSNNDAIKSYTKSIDLRENSIAFFRLAKIYRKNKDYPQAINFFSRLIRFDSSVRLAYYYLGECLYKQGELAKAYNYLSKAALFYPRDKEIVEQFKTVKKDLGEKFFREQKKEKEATRKKVKLPFYIFEQKPPFVSVGISKDLDRLSFYSAGTFTISDKKSSFTGEANRFYTLVLKNRKIVLEEYEKNTELAYFTAPIEIISLSSEKEKFPFYILDVVYGKANFWHKQIDRAYRGDLKIISAKDKMVLINILNVEEYLYGVLAAEIPPNSKPEALRAQAIAARTLAFRNRNRHKKEGFDFCSDVHCQVYQGLSSENSATNRAVTDTRGMILVCNNEPIEAFYHSNCGGCLSKDTFEDSNCFVSKIDAKEGNLPVSPYAEEIWFIDLPPVFCAQGAKTNIRWQRVYDAEDFLIAFGYPIDTLKNIIPRKKGDCFHYKVIDILTSKGKKTLKGDWEIREYFDKLKSSAFKLDIGLSFQGQTQMLFFWGGGFGHGTGMCQEGAIAMAGKGYSYKQILKHYYSNTEIKKLY